MHEYDIALKNILTRPGAGLLARLMGCKVAQWHNSELSGVRSRRADLLGETWEGTLIHVELQSSNDPRMVYRMLDYAIAIESSFGQFPNQMVLYVGEAPLRMERRLESAGSRLSFECAIVDIRELDGEPLLSSASLEDNVIAVLARLSDRQRAVRTILTRIAAGDPANRAVAMAELTILAGLRSLETVLEKEIERMPILNDIMDHKILGPKIRAAQALGEARGEAIGEARGEARGEAKGERTLITRQIGKRFGSVPDWVRPRLESLSVPELEALALRLLDAPTLEDLFG